MGTPHPQVMTDGDERRMARATLSAHRTFLRRLATCAGATIHRDDRGATWAIQSEGIEHGVHHPQFRGRDGSQRLHHIMRQYRRTPDLRCGTWAPILAVRPDLNALLVAQGFNWGGRGTAMACDLRRLTKPTTPDGVRLTETAEEAMWREHRHPYHHFESGERYTIQVRISVQAAQRWQDRVRHFVAWLDGRPVGHATVSLNLGRNGAAGIYDVGVLPEMRNRGIGRLVTHAACLQGRRWGARFAVLGASPLGHPVYRAIGFVDVGACYYWDCSSEALRARPLGSRQRAVVEAVCRGDRDAADRGLRAVDDRLLSEPTPNGMTLMEMAGRIGDAGMVRLLLDRGAEPEVLAFWRVGWRDEAAKLLSSPRRLNHLCPRRKMTVLHEAILLGDHDLARFLLDAGADTTIKDPTYHGDALGWAHHFGNDRIAAMITEKRQQRANH